MTEAIDQPNRIFRTRMRMDISFPYMEIPDDSSTPSPGK
jgi:hypothetical protein